MIQLLLPPRLRLTIRLQTTFKLVNLPPSIIKLLPHIVNPFRKPGLRFFTPLLEINLDLTESFQASDEVIMEYAKVRERLRFSLAPCFL